MRTPYITASVIGLSIAAWLLSGQINKPAIAPAVALASQHEANNARLEDRTAARVRARASQASLQTRFVTVRGKTENKRTVIVRAETSGTLATRPVERGNLVKQGQLLCQLSVEDREAGLLEAQEAEDQARVEYQGAVKLQARGFQSEVVIAQTKARHAAAKAQLKRRQLDLERTFIRAPFDGIIEDVHLELGDFVQPGADCATLIDLDPMLLVGRMPAHDIAQLTVGAPAAGKLSDGREIQGKISFLGQQADHATRTYAIEVEIPNADYQLRSGLTTDILLPVAQTLAHKISPALFALDDSGNLGVRTLTQDHFVEYHAIEVISQANDGVWVSGLPSKTILITVGQESVVEGEQVEAFYDAAPELPAAAPSVTPGARSRTPAKTQAENNTKANAGNAPASSSGQLVSLTALNASGRPAH